MPRPLHNRLMTSTAWDAIDFREDDIIIATYMKSGTTWMQQIVSQLIFDGAENLDIPTLSPWVDLRTLPPEALAALHAQPHRRFMKTHLPADALNMSDKAKYIHVGRDGRDTAWSLHNHHFNATDAYFERYNSGVDHLPPLTPGTPDPHEFYRQWMARDGFPMWSFWDHNRTWWAIRHQPNVKFIHYNDLTSDLPGTIRSIAQFLNMDIPDDRLDLITRHCSFAYMKANATTMVPRNGASWTGGAQTFINKGRNGRWRDTLSPAEIAGYEAKARAELGPDCAQWLEYGGAIGEISSGMP